MSRIPRHPKSNHHRRSGLSLVEVSISMLLVGLLLSASMNSFASSKRREWAVANKALAQQLSLDLLNEILRQPYEDPNASVVLFGLESGESTGNRSQFDDVDDYVSWSESPPADKNGNALAGMTNWTRRVTVQWADPTTLAASGSSGTGLKLITVTTTRTGSVGSTVTGYRSVAWVDTIPSPTDATGNHPPVAVATGTTLILLPPRTANFSGTTSTDSDGDTLSYVWNFGDGTNAAGSTVTHTYSSAGVYNCVLTVYDGHGGVSTATVTVSIVL